MQVPEAFLLLTLPSCSLSSQDFAESGTLGLECVTVPLPNASDSGDREVYLVLKLNATEIPIDPARVIQRSDTPVARVYTFNPTPSDPIELILSIATVSGDPKNDHLSDDLDTFEGLLEQYALDFRAPQTQTYASPKESPPPPKKASDITDLRGQLVMINEETGEVVGQVEDRFRIREDPVMYERGHERDPVVIDVPDEAGLRESDVDAMEAFACIVPPDQQDWITKSATIVRCVSTSFIVSLVLIGSTAMLSPSPPISSSPRSPRLPTIISRNQHHLHIILLI
jgi:spartin